MKPNAKRILKSITEAFNKSADVIYGGASESAKSAYAFMRASRKWTQKELANLKAYFESAEFEQHLDDFAQQINVDLKSSASAPGNEFINAKTRKLRIGTKLKIILEKCARDTIVATEVGGVVGVTFGPKGALAGVVFGATWKILFFAAAYYEVLNSSSESETSPA